MDRLRCILLGVGLLLAFPAQSDEVIRLSPGRSASFLLPENVTTGYSWRLDPGASDNLNILAITDMGHTRGAARLGAPGSRRWVVRALKPGRARIELQYQRPWESEPAETRRVDVVVSS